MTALRRHAVLLCAAFMALVHAGASHAEPYLAVRMGLKCAMCHENPTGGGLRTAFGNVFAQTMLPAAPLKPAADGGPWTGAIGKYLSLGADLRARGTYTDVPGNRTQDEFDLEELRLYAQLNAIPDRLALYVDQRLAPGTSTNLEAYGKLWFGDKRFYVKAGQMYLPFGLRLEDDTAFTRTASGINMTTPDRGVELGFETAAWSTQLAVSNGTAGAPEEDQGKQWSLRTEAVHQRWRAGASANFNMSDAGDRTMGSIFGGLRTGPVAWLGELGYIVDDGFPTGRRKQWAGLIEGNWAFRPGQNLKVTVEGFDPDDDIDEDEQNRYSVFWEYTPLPFVQLRVGARVYDGIPQAPLQNRRLVIAELHGFF